MEEWNRLLSVEEIHRKEVLREAGRKGKRK
jgi:hypothetical protein